MTRSCAFISFSLTVQPSLFRIFVNCSILKRRGSATHRTLPNLRRKAFSYCTPEQSQHGVQQRPAEAPVAKRCFTWVYTALHRQFQTCSWITNRAQTRKMHHILRLQADRRLNGTLPGPVILRTQRELANLPNESRSATANRRLNGTLPKSPLRPTRWSWYLKRRAAVRSRHWRRCLGARRRRGG